MNHFRTKLNAPLRNQGSALIAIIAAIAIFSVLAATLMTLTSTSEIQTAIGHWADQAFNMAESGYRYAKTQYQSASESTKMAVFDTLDENSPYTIHGIDNSFSLETESYFFVVEEDTATTSFPLSLKVHSPGGFPYENLDDLQNQLIQIEETVLTIQSCVTAEGTGNHTLTLSWASGPGLPDPLPAGTKMMPVIETDISQTLNAGGNISIPDGLSYLFPLYNGQLRVAGRTLTYRTKDATNNLLNDVVDANGASLTNLSIASGTKILLFPFVQISSTGIIGQGTDSVHRTIKYYSPLPMDQTETYSETFSGEKSILKPTTDSGGTDTMAIGTVGENENKVLKVTGSDNSESHAYLDVEGNNAKEALNDFRASTGGYLSYDAQTKVGFNPDSYFETANLAAGLSFRIRSENFDGATLYNMYGLSFLNKEIATNIAHPTFLDNITPDLLHHEPAIVLWQQTVSDDGTLNRLWLAYKKLIDTIDSFETGLNAEKWTDEYGNWAWDQYTKSIAISTYENDYEGHIYYQTILPLDENGEHQNYTLRFDHGGDDWAHRTVRVIAYSSGEQNVVYNREYAPPFDMSTVSISLPTFADEIIVDFSFLNERDYGAWKIENFKIFRNSPIQNSALLVRLKESAVIHFNYNESESLTFSKGDRIFGASGAYGRLIVPPILTGSSDPTGYLLLNSVSSKWFEENEALTSWGKGSIAHVNGAPSAEKYRRANIIKVYYASENGLNDPTPENSSPLDCYTNAYGRLSATDPFQWPVQEGTEWTSNRDYFQIIQWDVINSDTTLNTEETLFGTLIDTYDGDPKDNTIIISHNTKLQSVDIDATSPELGLHAIGDAAGSYVNHVYFDDFGFQLYQLPNALFPDAFQQ